MLGHVADPVARPDRGGSEHPDSAGSRLEQAQDQLEQRRLAAAIGADEADLVATQHGGREVIDQELVAEVHAHILEFGNDLARRQPGIQLEPHLTQHVAPGGALLAQPEEPADAADHGSLRLPVSSSW